MKVKGQDIYEAYKKWLEADVASISSTRHDLGKFYFTVSSSVIGITLAAAKTIAVSSNTLLLVSVVLLTIAASMGLYLSLPSREPFKDGQDISAFHSQKVDFLIHFSWIWFLIVMAGAIAAFFSIDLE